MDCFQFIGVSFWLGFGQKTKILKTISYFSPGKFLLFSTGVPLLTQFFETLEKQPCKQRSDLLLNGPSTERQNKPTDKRTDVWSRDFGLWAVAWAGQWEKRVWADYEQLLRPVFSLFRGQKNFFLIF